jgi:X-Pro dipeptidyl-peptidase
MKFLKQTILFLLFLGMAGHHLLAQVKPIFENGEAQIIPELEEPANWIRTDLWVETEFDTDGDGKKDRMHVDVPDPNRPKRKD